jgi:hypothetical protein
MAVIRPGQTTFAYPACSHRWILPGRESWLLEGVPSWFELWGLDGYQILNRSRKYSDRNPSGVDVDEGGAEMYVRGGIGCGMDVRKEDGEESEYGGVLLRVKKATAPLSLRLKHRRSMNMSAQERVEGLRQELPTGVTPLQMFFEFINL